MIGQRSTSPRQRTDWQTSKDYMTNHSPRTYTPLFTSLFLVLVVCSHPLSDILTSEDSLSTLTVDAAYRILDRLDRSSDAVALEIAGEFVVHCHTRTVCLTGPRDSDHTRGC